MAKIIITAANSFIGRRLCKVLTARNVMTNRYRKRIAGTLLAAYIVLSGKVVI